jgi:hypothetical protein
MILNMKWDPERSASKWCPHLRYQSPITMTSLRMHLINQVVKRFKKSSKQANDLVIGIAQDLRIEGTYLSSDPSASIRAIRAVIRRSDFRSAIERGETLHQLKTRIKVAPTNHIGKNVILLQPDCTITRVGLGKGAYSVIYS